MKHHVLPSAPVSGVWRLSSVVWFLSSVVWFLASGLTSALEPAVLSIASVREEPVANASETYFYAGHPLLLTNCVAYSGTSTSSAPQNLSNVAVIVQLGVPTNNVAYTGAVANAAAGTWWARIEALPTNWDAPFLFLQLTNAAETFGYPFKILKVKTPL